MFVFVIVYILKNIIFLAQASSPERKLGNNYCEQNSKWACYDETSSLCRLLKNTCTVTTAIASEEQIKAHNEGRVPELTPAALLEQNQCLKGTCSGGIILNPLWDLECPEKNLEKKEETSKIKKVKGDWVPIFSVEAVYRVQTGARVKAYSQSMSYIHMKKILGQYKTINQYTMEKTLSQNSTEDFKKFIAQNYPELQDQFNVIDMTRMMIGMKESDMIRFAQKKSGELNFDQKVGLIASILSMWNKNYDKSRNLPDSPNSRGVVEIDDMMNGVKESIDGVKTKAGVCRDMHIGAAKIARALGIEDVYGISYNALAAGHLNMVLQDPKDRKKIYKINYGGITLQKDCIGEDCLEQRDTFTGHGTIAKGWGANDELYFILPNTVGAALHRATGGKADDIFPLYEYQDSHINANASIGPVQINAFQASGSNNDMSVVGMAANVEELKYNALGVEGGAAFYHAEYSGHKTQGGFYRYKARVAPELKLSTKTVTPALSFGENYANYNFHSTKSTAVSNETIGGSNNRFFTVAAELEIKDKEYKVVAKGQSQMIRQEGARLSNSKYQELSATPPVLSVEYDVQKKVTEDIKGELKVSTSIVLLPSGVHPNVKVRGKLSGRIGSVSLTVCGSLNKNTPLYIPAAGRCLQGSFEAKIVNGVVVTASSGIQECGGGYCSFATAGLAVTTK